ncbi:MAG: winged helix-turn-helix domain-containing protein [Fusobacteriaceae bacterium]|nr:winged helix-turn-helix domain-containing protein [Fusobacteriaceae bacterium]MBN2837174.1 winged helix-turn-helix domain-containing protein [Fusobacteriaceae bacterium]
MRYSSEKIGNDAGKIWESLNASPKQTIKSLEQATELKREEILLALGWLFKEDKIFAETAGSSVKVSLK